MPSLTDSAIKQGLTRVENNQKQENLADGDCRGTGRLILVLKPMPKRVTAPSAKRTAGSVFDNQ